MPGWLTWCFQTQRQFRCFTTTLLKVGGQCWHTPISPFATPSPVFLLLSPLFFLYLLFRGKQTHCRAHLLSAIQHLMGKTTEQGSKYRQQIAATAIVYFRRAYFLYASLEHCLHQLSPQPNMVSELFCTCALIFLFFFFFFCLSLFLCALHDHPKI